MLGRPRRTSLQEWAARRRRRRSGGGDSAAPRDSTPARLRLGGVPSRDAGRRRRLLGPVEPAGWRSLRGSRTGSWPMPAARTGSWLAARSGAIDGGPSSYPGHSPPLSMGYDLWEIRSAFPYPLAYLFPFPTTPSKQRIQFPPYLISTTVYVLL